MLKIREVEAAIPIGVLDKYLKIIERPHRTTEEEHASYSWFSCID